MPKYSVIIPVYNCENYLTPCVRSVLDQSCSDFELLLVDDGSTDGSGMLCDQLAEQDSRIRVFHKENGGAASARNYGLDHAVGSRVMFLDGDDTITEDCLETAGEASEADLIIFGMEFDYYRGDRLTEQRLNSVRYSGLFTTRELAADFIGFFNDNQLSSACNKLFCRSALDEQELRFQEGLSLYEDFDFVLRYLTTARRICCVNRPLYRYRIVFRGASYRNRRTETTARIREGMLPIKQSLDAFYAAHPEPEVKSVLANLYMMLLQQHLIQRRSVSRPELLSELRAYCEDETLQSALRSGGVLDDCNRQLYEMILRGDVGEILRIFRIRRWKQGIRRVVQSIKLVGSKTLSEGSA